MERYNARMKNLTFASSAGPRLTHEQLLKLTDEVMARNNAITHNIHPNFQRHPEVRMFPGQAEGQPSGDWFLEVGFGAGCVTATVHQNHLTPLLADLQANVAPYLAVLRIEWFMGQ